MDNWLMNCPDKGPNDWLPTIPPLAGHEPLSDRHSGQLVQPVLHNGTPGAHLAGSGPLGRGLPAGTRGAPDSAGGPAENTTFRQIRGEFRPDAAFLYLF